MDRTGSRKQKIKDTAYLVISVLIVIALLIGICITKDDIFPFSEYKDSFWVALPYTIIVFLVVQMSGIIFIGKVREHFMSVSAITLSSFGSFQLTFIIIAFCRNTPHGQAMNFFKSILFDLYWSAGLVWADYGSDIHWLYPDGYPIIFIFLATIFLTTFEYFWLRKRTEKKKTLFLIILISSFMLCTAVSVFMKINY